VFIENCFVLPAGRSVGIACALSGGWTSERAADTVGVPCVRYSLISGRVRRLVTVGTFVVSALTRAYVNSEEGR
jgi:hypothetical protein